MKKNKRALWNLIPLFITCSLIFHSCNSVTNSDSSAGGGDRDWLIPRGEVVDGGPGKDGIPSIDDPNFASVSSINFIPDNRMVIGLQIGNEIKVYPHQIMDWHEIVNDRVGDKAVALTFCPLTGTALAWNREINGNVTEFGVSGLLFRNNLIPYDRNSDSYWSQMQVRSVAGPLSSSQTETFQVVETRWETWKKLYPDAQVLTTDTGFSRNYSGFTYGSDYSTNHDRIIFPIRNRNNALQNKTRVHGLLPEEGAEPSEYSPLVFPINRFSEGIEVIQESFDGREIVVVGSSGHDFAAAFSRLSPEGTLLEFEAVSDDQLPVVMRDSEGNLWDLFGNAVSGPRQGERLTALKSYTGYWFGWADFFPDLRIHEPSSN